MDVLEIGSGTDTSGEHFPLSASNALHLDLMRNAFDLDILADGSRLPFRDKSFNVVFCSHVLEHVADPFALLREIRRVARRLVVLKIPNASYYRYNFIPDSSEHLFSWNHATFANLLKQIFPRVRLKFTHRITPTQYSKGFYRRWLSIAMMYAEALLGGRGHTELTAIMKLP